MGSEPWHRQTGETDKGCPIPDLNGPKTKATLAKMLLDALDHRVALNSIETTREELHDARISIHCGKRSSIVIAPLAEANAVAG
jgi:hypothetical protein